MASALKTLSVKHPRAAAAAANSLAATVPPKNKFQNLDAMTSIGQTQVNTAASAPTPPLPGSATAEAVTEAYSKATPVLGQFAINAAKTTAATAAAKAAGSAR